MKAQEGWDTSWEFVAQRNLRDVATAIMEMTNVGSTLLRGSSQKKPQDSKLSFFPKAPLKPEELDIPVSMAEDLMLRYLYTKGSSSRGLINSF
jgi:hypothetical protein